MTNEYIKSFRFSYDELLKMKDAQLQVIINGIKDPNESSLLNGLIEVAGTASIVLSFCFGLGTAAAVTGTTLSVVSGLSGWEKDALEKATRDGLIFLDELERWWRNNPEYDELEVRMTVLKYVNEGIYYIIMNVWEGDDFKIVDYIDMGYVDGQPVRP
ncbi:hypothetical protein [Caldisalinibacter kiritimatiensis]|uniref:Uncharacterized protein n=1 Tax=Caldisalinibacter kiritimatiensis TaxID=1304284 RepID=R1AS28_9FIRM|nr:hypothetical protein [Caldisalinibacter kiritimatiensis]EOC99942.1 hypothetical protein L21TH_2017 [Caldisalinibacter kiritimatiensis]